MCKNKRVLDETIELKDNAMLKARPDLFEKWDFEMNDKLGFNIYKVTKWSNKRAWWKCFSCGESYPRIVGSEMKYSGCPVCTNREIIVGFNDMWTTNPDLAKLLLNPEDGYKYGQGWSTKVDWECAECGEIIKNKQISNFKNSGLFCFSCSDGKSFGEKFMYHILKELKINFEWEKTFEWLPNRRYDFSLPDSKIIIEVNGRQHSEEGCFNRLSRSRSLDEEKQNDKLKFKKAASNGVKIYYVNALNTDFHSMKNEVVKIGLFNDMNIDYENCYQKASKSLLVEVCSKWDGIKTSTDIANDMNMHKPTVVKYLNNGSSIGLCSYDAKEEMAKNAKKQAEKLKIKVVQLTIENVYVNQYESLSEAARIVGYNHSSIGRVCKGKQKTSGGFKWMYKKDYDKLMSA